LANPQSNKIVRTLGLSFPASASHHNIETLIPVGLILVEREGRSFLMVIPKKARKVRGLAAVEQDGRIFPPDALGRFRLPTGI
jgi:hypothetical protein